jgi:hypothetical protein
MEKGWLRCLAFLAAMPPAVGEAATVNVVWETPPQPGLDGDIRGAAFDVETGQVLVATSKTLYRRQKDGMEVVPIGSPESRARGFLVLSPGGNRVLRTYRDPSEASLLNGTLYDISGKKVATVRPGGRPSGFTGLQMERSFFITPTPLDDAEGANGRYRYTFWGADGAEGKKVEFPRFQKVVLEPEGPSVLFLGKGRAVAHQAIGEQLWDLPGEFHAGAISRGGSWAVLAFSTGNKQGERGLRVRRQETTNSVFTPVIFQDVRISPEIENPPKAIAFNQEQYFVLDLTSLELQQGLGFQLNRDFHITDAGFLGGGLRVFALRLLTGPQEGGFWRDGLVIVVNQGGEVTWSHPLRPTEPGDGYPHLLVPKAGKWFVAFTKIEAFLARVAE